MEVVPSKSEDVVTKEGDNGEDEGCHPLMNSVILRNIFQYNTVKDLKNLRLVCSLWYELASPYLQQNSMVVLHEELFRRGTSIKTFLDYIDQLENSERIFFRNYKITLLTLDKSNDNILRFWEKIGPSMSSLDMSWCRFKGIETVRNVMFRWTPNLTHFSLRDSTFYRDDDPYVVEYEVAPYDQSVRINRNMTSLEFYGGESRVGPPVSWEEVIVAYPNLKQLLLNNISLQGINDILSEIYNTRKKDPSKLNIEKLNIFNGDFAFGQLTGPVAQLLMDLKLPITHLNLDVGMNTSDLTMASILKTYSKTLRHLTMYRGPFAIPFYTFPFEITFPELISLELSDSITDNLSFVLFTPKLQKLSICESPDSEPPILPTDIIMNTNSLFCKSSLPVHLRKLRLDYDCSLGDVRKLVRSFPEVKALRMYLDNESFRLICGEWKDLEELEILGDKVTDEGITGLSLSSLDSQLVVTKKSLSIRNLNSLRIFVMKNYGISTSISDISVHHAFCQMARLYHLELCSKLISDDGWKLLHAMPNLTILEPFDGSWESKCANYSKGIK